MSEGNGSSPPERQGWTFRLSRHFVLRQDLDATTKIVAIALLSFANKNGLCCPTSPQIGRALGIHPATVDLRLIILRNALLIAWELKREKDGKLRRHFNLNPASNIRPSERLFIPPSDWDGLGGKRFDGKRTMRNHPSA